MISLRGRSLQRFACSMRFLHDPKVRQGGFHGVGGVVEDRIPRCCMSASSCTGSDSWAFAALPLVLAVAGGTSGLSLSGR